MHRALLPIAALLALACGEPAPPRIVEVELPGDTRDPVGPYLVTAVIEGADSATVVYSPGQDDVDLVGGQRAPMVQLSQSWEGRVPGLPPARGRIYRVWVEASNEAGTTRSDALEFRVLDPDGACLVDGECLPDEICGDGTCRRPPAVCASDADCGQDFYCPIAGEPCRFRPTDCLEDGDCAGGDVCLDGRCAPEPQCRVDLDCPDGPCVDGRCVPRDRCVDDGDCPPETACVDGACVLACLRDEQCAPDEVCRDMQCVPAGQLACPGGCPEGSHCLPSEGRCVFCTADGHCPGGHCDLAAWACAPRERGRPCVPCGPQTLCGGGYACPAEVGGACIPRCNADCGAGCEETCAVPPDRFCGGPVCDVDGDCDSAVCLSGWCEPRQFCVRDADCAADRRCADGRCVPLAAACRRPGDCADDEICLGGRCSPGRPIDPCDRCDFDHDCPSPALCVPFDDGQRRCAALCGSECPGDALQCLTVDAGLLVCLAPDASCPVSVCGVDDLEPNDEPRSSTRMLVGAVLQGVLCDRDAEWLRLDAPAGAVLFVETRGVLNLTLTDSERNVLREIDVPAGGSVEVTLPQNTFFARLTTVALGEFVWDAVLGPPAPPDCDDDGFEENDDADEATVLGNGADIRAVACPGDDDWFRVRTRRRDGTIDIVGPPDATLDVRLLDSAETVLDVQRGPGQLELSPPPGLDEVFVVLRCDGCAEAAAYRLRTLLER